MKPLILSAALLMAASNASAADTAIRLYPGSQVWAYELEAARNLHSAVLHNTAVVNSGAADVMVETVRYELLRDNAVVLSKTLHASDLDKAAKTGNALKQSGMMDALDFQFAPSKLLGGSTIAASRTIPKGQALYIPVQVLAFNGKPQTVRVTVDFAGNVADAVSTIPLKFGAAPGRWVLPLQGRWIAGAGSTLHSHHRWAVPEEFAFDFVRHGASGGTYAGNGSKVTDFYAYGQPVLASADGEVVATLDGMADSAEYLRKSGESLADYQKRLMEMQGAKLAEGTEKMAGNHVILKHGEGVYSVYGHLKPGSLKVAKGEKVVAGQKIGAIGSSGNSTEPHLHFHVCDQPDALQCAGIPVKFENVEIPASESNRQIQSGDVIETTGSSK